MLPPKTPRLHFLVNPFGERVTPANRFPESIVVKPGTISKNLASQLITAQGLG